MGTAPLPKRLVSEGFTEKVAVLVSALQADHRPYQVSGPPPASEGGDKPEVQTVWGPKADGDVTSCRNAQPEGLPHGSAFQLVR